MRYGIKFVMQWKPKISLNRRNKTMIRRKCICKKCGHKFEIDVFEPGEAEEKRMPSGPVRCPKCGGPVEKRA